MQASLPDLNTQFIKNKNKAISAADNKEWTTAIGAVYSINALLPDDFQITVSTIKYLSELQTSIVGVCEHCDQEIENFDHVPKLELILSQTERMVIGSKSSTVWDCPNCKKMNYLDGTKTKIMKKQEPFYSKTIPKPPEFKHGFGGRVRYDQDMLNWFWNSINEIDHAMMEYRRSYKGKDEIDESGLESLLDKIEGLE